MQVDMSPKAVGHRLQLMDELWELSVQLMRSKKVGGPEDQVSSLVDAFRQAAIEKGDFATPAKRDHQLYDAMRNSYVELKSMGRTGDDALTLLLDDDSVHVRTWIAAALLVDGNIRARQVLESIANGSRGATRLDAQMVLEEFDKGTLKSPFP
jgi:hypothetical protein